MSEDEDEDAIDEDFEESEEFLLESLNLVNGINPSQAGSDFSNMSSIMQASPSPFVKRQHTKISEEPNEDEDHEETKHPPRDDNDEADLEDV